MNIGLKAAFGPGLDWQTSKGKISFDGAHPAGRQPYPSMVTTAFPDSGINVRHPSNLSLQALVTLSQPVAVEQPRHLHAA